MAISPRDSDEAFLREVDEGVRRDQMLSAWQRYGKLGIALLVLALAALAGWLWWQDSQAKARGQAGEDLTQAMSQLDVGEGAKARPVLNRMASEGPGSYKALASMVLANDAVAGGNTADAIKKLDAIAADAGLAQPLRDAALVKSVRLSFDTVPPATVIARLKGLAVPGNPWFGVAGEISAMAQIKAGKPEIARPILTAIAKDNGQPASLRSRTAQMALSLGAQPGELGLNEGNGAAPAGAPGATPAPEAADRG